MDRHVDYPDSELSLALTQAVIQDARKATLRSQPDLQVPAWSYSTATFASFTRTANFSVSSLICCAICAWLSPIGSAPSSPMRF